MNKKKSIVILSIFTVLVILGGVFAFVSLDNGELGIYNYIAFPKTIKLGLDLSGGAYAVFDVDQNAVIDTTDAGVERKWADLESDERDRLIEGTRSSLESLLVEKGYTEAQVTTYDNRIRVEVPDVDDPDRIFDLIGRPASLEFKKYEGEYSQGAGVSYDDPITGKDIAQTGVTYNSESGSYEVALKFTSKGAKKFADATAEASSSTSKRIGIYINKEEVIAPQVSSTISGGNASISGNYTYEQAYELAVKIQAGSFPLTLKMSESNTITATLGTNAIKAGVIAGIVGLALIIIYLCIFYRMMGVASSLSLIYYALTYVFLLAILPWVQLTLSGIAGVLLSIGMAVDANVIIFERIKEEHRAGKMMRTAVSNGFKRSYGAIIDGNVTTIIGAIVLIIVGAASIKGFGITLLVGIVLSLLSSLFLTRLLLSCIMVWFKEEDAPKFALKSYAGVANEPALAEEVK